jgi:two-component system sensor histidine kinase VicK
MLRITFMIVIAIVAVAAILSLSVFTLAYTADYESTILSTEGDDVFIQADKIRIGQVISNLLNNAIRFTQQRKSQENTNISVTLEERTNDDNNKKEVVVTIKDTGVGIAPEIMPRLFTKFATKSEKGTGLGLFISKSIIEVHGGKIWAENNKEGKGAIFEFTLPIVSL